MIFCRSIERTPSGLNLLGIFELVQALRFPMRFPNFLVQVRLHAIEPIYDKDIQAKIVMEHDGKDLAGAENILKKANALKNQTISLDFKFDELIFKESGTYTFKLYIEGKLLIEQPLQVVPLSE